MERSTQEPNSETLKTTVEIASKAGTILKKYFESGDYSQKGKGGVDLLTQADEEADKFIIEELERSFPTSQILTEETAPADYSTLEDSPSLWIVDPLDGTVNFTRKNPNFAVSIALVENGKTSLGVVHRPITGETIWARKDEKGAFLNGNMIHVSSTPDLKQAVLAMDWAWDLEKRKMIPKWQERLLGITRQIKMMGSAVSDLSTLAQGGIDAYIHSGLKPWDMAATSLIIEKAGGKITTPQGKDWHVFSPDILASNGVLHEPILELIKD